MYVKKTADKNKFKIYSYRLIKLLFLNGVSNLI